MKIGSLICIGFATALILVSQASKWWERGYATFTYSEISPDRCLRLDGFKPFWILPSVLQYAPDFDPEEPDTIGRMWDAPIFYRLFDLSTGAFIGESVVFDATMGNGPTGWGTWNAAGRREVSVGGFRVAVTSHCAGEQSRQTVRDYELGTGEFADPEERAREAAQHRAWLKETLELQDKVLTLTPFMLTSTFATRRAIMKLQVESYRLTRESTGKAHRGAKNFWSTMFGW